MVCCLCTCQKILRRSLSNIKDCSTAGSESTGPTEFTSSHRVVPPVVARSKTARKPSATTSAIITSTHAANAGRPRIARRPLNDTLPERPTTSRTANAEAVSARPQRRSCSLDSKKSSTRQYQGLSASALLAESTSIFKIYSCFILLLPFITFVVFRLRWNLETRVATIRRYAPLSCS